MSDHLASSPTAPSTPASLPGMSVWVVFHETNTGRSEGSDGYVESIHATEAGAESEALRLLRALRDRGAAIWHDPDDPDDEGTDDWEHDIIVYETQVQP